MPAREVHRENAIAPPWNPGFCCKNEILIHLENELNYSLGNNKSKKLQNIESYHLESEVRRILNKFLKSEIGKKPHISICIHRMDII